MSQASKQYFGPADKKLTTDEEALTELNLCSILSQ
eukprot:CAMPEP_0170506252 /NCGR_PEP_ID=MMETSP0208-20121228/54223_1 /TAXON_ID=197538 /ORGANISM="Strombidium inclinatum, Strain S3" /LENGTH=34 /DNA_ID= /DNA_START= /DNA_END= /DNA_ORIENTATION=